MWTGNKDIITSGLIMHSVHGNEFSLLGLPTVISLLIHIFRLLIMITKQVRTTISNALHLMIEMVMCHHIPGAPAALVNVEKQGVAGG